MRVVFLAHEIVGLQDSLKIVAVSADSQSHKEMLGTLRDLAVHTEKIGMLESFETKAV